MHIDHDQQPSFGCFAQHQLNLVEVTHVDQFGGASLIVFAGRDFPIDHDSMVVHKNADCVEALLHDEIEKAVHTALR